MFASYSRNFFQKEKPKFAIFPGAFFLGRIILKYIKNKKALEGSGGMLPRKIIENLHAIVAILALFEQFFWQIFV